MCVRKREENMYVHRSGRKGTHVCMYACVKVCVQAKSAVKSSIKACTVKVRNARSLMFLLFLYVLAMLWQAGRGKMQCKSEAKR